MFGVLARREGDSRRDKPVGVVDMVRQKRLLRHDVAKSVWEWREAIIG